MNQCTLSKYGDQPVWSIQERNGVHTRFTQGTLENDYKVSGGTIMVENSKGANLHSLEVWYNLRVRLWRWYHGIKFRNGNAPRAFLCPWSLVIRSWIQPTGRGRSYAKLGLLVTGQQVRHTHKRAILWGTWKAPGNRRSRRCGPKPPVSVFRSLLLVTSTIMSPPARWEKVTHSPVYITVVSSWSFLIGSYHHRSRIVRHICSEVRCANLTLVPNLAVLASNLPYCLLPKVPPSCWTSKARSVLRHTFRSYIPMLRHLPWRPMSGKRRILSDW